MEYWEFLLQKEGERSWRPIKLPKMEIDAGRYRVVSHSSRLNTDVEICVTHTSTDEVPPKRRSQKRSRRTNPEGLMVVIPFTYLKPGLWELRCCGDIMSDFLGKSWQHSVQLNVLSQATATLPEGEQGPPVVEVTATEAQESVSEPLSFSSSPERVIELPSTDIEAVPLTPPAQTETVSGDGDSQEEQGSDVRSEEQANSPDATPFGSQDEVISESQTQEEERATVLEEVWSKAVGDREDKAHYPSQPTTDSHTVPEVEVSSSDCEIEQQPELSTTPPALYTPAPSYEIPSWEAAPLTELPNPKADAVEPLPTTSADLSIPLEPTESDDTQNAIASSVPEEHASNVSEVATPTNPILDESLQMLEQVLQQVLDPVLLELEQPEPLNSQFLELLEPEPALEPEPDKQGFILTLSEESLIARRDEPFTIAGQVDIMESDRETTSDASNRFFRGSLRYVLREPQTSQILLDVQESLAEQSLPLSFSHTLAIPANCNTRLILAKATLHSSTEATLASQSFSITVDLDELLGAIIPGTQMMPVAKVQLPTNDSIDSLALLEPQEERPEVVLPPVNQASLDLVDLSPKPQPFQLQPVSRQPLPPQIYQPTTPSPKGSKSLQLPNLPKVQPVASTPPLDGIPDTANGLDNDAVEPDDAIMPGLLAANGFSPEIDEREPAATAEVTTPELHTQAAEEWEEATVPNDSVEVDDALLGILSAIKEFDDSMSVTGLHRSDALAFGSTQNSFASSSESSPETFETSELTTDAQLEVSSASEVETAEPTSLDSPLSETEAIAGTTEPEAENPSSEHSVTVPVVNASTPLDSAFPASNIQERFWTRLNLLATDTQSTTWLWPDLSPSDESEDVEDFTEEALNPELLNEFDESLWAEESEEFGSAIAFPRERNGNGTAQAETAREPIDRQPPSDEEIPPAQEATPEQATFEDNTAPDWTAQEFVVEDQEFVVEEDEEPLLPAPQELQTPPQPQLVQPQPVPTVEPVRPPSYSPEPRILLPREFETPLPEPELLIPTSELAAGETVTVRVHLPPHPVRLYVKLWVQDRQSRSLLDGPRWLVDFIPDRSGEQEALTQLVVPFGSAEIRFEAIAVDVDTQRESRKVSVDCVVVPPDLQDFSVDEF